MPERNPHNVVLTQQAAQLLRKEFIGWQCRLRQLAMRQGGGRPTSGMQPRVLSLRGEEIAPRVTVLLNELEPDHSISQFKFQYQRTQDPIERYDKILETLSGSYFQQPGNFSDVMTGLFGPDSAIAGMLLNQGRCVLEFEQFTQAYRLTCAVRELAESQPWHQATYWHNRMFNPNMHDGIRILAFTPDWRHSEDYRVET
ncbi:MAG TPA: hypothetical protein VMT98_19875 [Verrucomicrobiae bacterium]|nr:hypothetical protein [Verrucomicrobiae bacterium]